MWDILVAQLTQNGLITSFVIVGVTMYVAYMLSAKLTKGKFHGSAIAIILGLVLAYVGGAATDGGSKGLASIPMFAGVGLMGGSMLRDLAIVATSFGVDLREVKKSGLSGTVSLFMGIFVSFFIGAGMAIAFGYTDAVSITTIGAGAVTYIVGPVTGAAVGADSAVVALSVAAGLVKSILVMTSTPLFAKIVGLDNPNSAMVFGGLMGTTSGVTAGLAATNPKLVPYGAMTSTFYTGLGCLLCPSVLFLLMKGIYG
ncbi:malonate transporter, MadM subunit [Malonomonas rubra DSM 5091]|uniref:Malonate transporter, MadM subunit n=2 Tax=Malonomonas rubra TaxID=57040 RepID=A0A1M6NQH5_MALRU|nr:malonate transporter subunit MadM [Malonomonas rubra]AAC45408.1 MadM [Malonomonas rubra]SHJ97955.1 malonate transporter, MadM subunit [Malonomonas rubra DSM 5091]